MSGKVSLRKQNSTSKKAQTKAGTCTRSCDFGAMRYAKRVCRKVAAVAVRVTGGTVAPPKLPLRNNKNNNDDDDNKEMRAKTSVAPVDSQRAEAIHDCIDFINSSSSSSSLPRSNSVVAR